MQSQSRSPRQQQGVVIVVALFMVALVATMAYIMMSRFERDVYRSRLIMNNTQAEFYAQGSIIWAIDQLREDWIRQKANKLIDVNPITSPENIVNGYRISSIVYDMQDRFNLNNLNNPEAQRDFIRLLKIVDPTLHDDSAQKIVRAIEDWIKPQNEGDKNEFSEYYLKLPMPYRAAHRTMISISELNLVKGMTPKLYNAIKPYVCVLPVTTTINVQTAGIPVLASISETMTEATAKALIEARTKKPFTSTDDFWNLDIVKNHHLASDKTKEKVAVTSSYFLVETNVSIEEQHMVLYTLLERNAQQGNVKVRIIWQSK